MVGQQAWISQFKATLDVCVKTMPEGVGKEDWINILQWAKGYLDVKVHGMRHASSFCVELLGQNNCDYLKRKAPDILEDEDCAAQLEACDDFVRGELDHDFADFDYAPWNAMIKRLFPESDDGEEEVESDVGKGKGRAAGSSKVGPPAATMRTLSKAKPATQTARRVTVKAVLKERMMRSQSLTDICAGEKPAPVLKSEVRALLPIFGFLC